MEKPGLERRLNLLQATAINMIDMVGIGPFVTLSVIAGALNGWNCLWAWVIGAVLSYTDGTVWAELGSRFPEAGGSYVFLQKLYGNKAGRAMSFLFVWQTTFQAPLVMASAAIGFSQYFNYLYPLGFWQEKIVSGSLIILMVILLYRKIGEIGKISTLLSVITVATILFIIISAFVPHSSSVSYADTDLTAVIKPISFAALALASKSAIYSYLGYYNVCHLGAEIKDPQKNIPMAIFISITGIALLYLGMQYAVTKVLPWQAVAASKFPISLYFNEIFGFKVATVVTGFILIIALSSLFSVMLGYSRIPYAAARDGNFFKLFSTLHPRLHFPHYSLLLMGSLAFIFSLLFRLGDVIAAIITVRIFIQFIAQAVGIIWYRRRHAPEGENFKMPFFPVPALISIAIWLFLFSFSSINMIGLATGIIGSGLLVYFIKERLSKNQ